MLKDRRVVSSILAAAAAILIAGPPRALGQQLTLPVRISWGHTSPADSPFTVQLRGENLSITAVRPLEQEASDAVREGFFWETRAGQSDVDGLDLILSYAAAEIGTVSELNSMWRDLIAHSDPDTAERLRMDAGLRLDSRRLTVRLDRAGTRGFSVTVDQLLQNRSFWVPALDVYLTVGEMPQAFDDHQQDLQPYRGRRILDQVQHAPESTYAEYTARWEDMGSIAYKHPSQPLPGHIIGLAWDSSVPKFGLDRAGGVRNDLGNPDRFRGWFGFGDLSQDVRSTWRGQSLEDGLPIVTTEFEQDGIGWKLQQFAYPLLGPPAQRRGDIEVVLLQRVELVNRTDSLRTVPLQFNHWRKRPVGQAMARILGRSENGWTIEDEVSGRILVAVHGVEPSEAQIVPVDRQSARWQVTPDEVEDGDCVGLMWPVRLAAAESKAFVVKLPSPSVKAEDRARLLALDDAVARQQTRDFWLDWLDRGAQFHVPEKTVNDLFRANLWHALRLPRRYGGQQPEVAIDLPYSNFAYDQRGTPWPVNQAVYVDSMIYDLRGYHDVSVEELSTIYRNNQQPDGRVAGYANWGVYTPSMIYASAQNYLLSQDRTALERLLPSTLKALDWCLEQVRSAQNSAATRGMVFAPLNDLSGDGVWAFNQAYFYAALQILGQALQRYGHPRAQECLDAADEFRHSVERAYAEATFASPLVQLRDHSWSPYVPCEATTPRRRFDQWYPTDVDTGAVHLLRLGALPPRGWLADCLLNDHEDNLFLHGWGMANEPVYNQQATAYLSRDETLAVIRAFYSYMACAFSHSALEPVEHRWTWGQYFGPPSTDGAWFDLYRHMLIEDRNADRLMLFAATPRAWLADGQSIEITRAPTRFGQLSARLDSHSASDRFRVELTCAWSYRPKWLVVRIRHPQQKTIQNVRVNGSAWRMFDPTQETILIPNPPAETHVIEVGYSP